MLFLRDLSTASPPTFLQATVRAAAHFACNKTVAGLVSTRVTLLTKGILHTMLMSKLKAIAGLFLALSLVGVGSGALAYRTLTIETPPQVSDLEIPRVREGGESGKPNRAPPTPNRSEPFVDQKGNQRELQEQGESQHKAEEVISRSFKTGKSPKVVVESFNGNLTVEANLEGVVDTRVIKQSQHATEQQAQEGLKNIDLTMT
jgi:hypothetical protein